MRIFNRLSIRLIGATLGLLGLIWVLLALDRLSVEQEALDLQLHRQGEALAAATASSAALSLRTGDQERVRAFAERLIGLQVEATSIRLYGPTRELVLEVVPSVARARGDDLVFDKVIEDPSTGAILGTISVAMSLAHNERLLAERLRAFMWKNLGAFSVVALVLAVLVRHLVGLPLQLLATQAAVLGRGDLTHPVALDSPTELGELARHLDEMRRHLKTSQRVLLATNTKLNDALSSLDVALDEAHAANRAKANFLATMSHEIRTPMNGVLGMAEVLRGMDLSSSQRSIVGTIYHSAESLLAIINDVLDFSKIEAGKLAMEQIGFDLRVAIEEVLELLSVQAQAKPLELVLRYKSEVPRYVLGDVVRIRQVLTNLIGNGVKFTAEGHVAVEVTCEIRDETRARLLVKVTDTGIGISADKLPGMFERFTQADSSTTRTHGGTGLGLAISRRLVELMGGTMGVESTLGEGSTFWFRLTLPLDPAPPAPAPLPAVELRGLRALAVCAHALFRETVVEALAEVGVSVEGMASATDALHALQLTTTASERIYDVIVVEAELPGVGGLELVRMLAAEARFGPIVKILLVVRGRMPGGALPIDVAIAKPIRQRALIEGLAESLARRAHGGEDTGKYLAVVPTPTPFNLEVAREATPRFAGRVLLVEDNLVNQKVAIALLSRLGLAVDVAGNGQEGVERSIEAPYDLILMDCQMPVMDGFEATREIRRWEHLGSLHTPIIAMTANAMAGDRERCLDAGMDDYVAKPVRREALEAVLARWLERPSEEVPA